MVLPGKRARALCAYGRGGGRVGPGRLLPGEREEGREGMVIAELPRASVCERSLMVCSPLSASVQRAVRGTDMPYGAVRCAVLA
eukprot:810836-Rhodomonas_salina.3